MPEDPASLLSSNGDPHSLLCLPCFVEGLRIGRIPATLPVLKSVLHGLSVKWSVGGAHDDALNFATAARGGSRSWYTAF